MASNAAPFTEEYRVFVHFLDDNEQMMWTDDHAPPVPATQWKPGQKISYRRTIFVPIYPYVGEATVRMGLYGPKNSRVPFSGDDNGQRAYKVGTLQLLPQTDNIFVIYKDGWYQSEVSETDAAVEWQWSKKDASVTFRNPKRNVLVYLHADTSRSVLPQQVQITTPHGFAEQFHIDSAEPFIKKLPMSAAQLGPADMATIKLSVGRTFVPAKVAGTSSNDARELGLRVFHLYIEPR